MSDGLKGVVVSHGTVAKALVDAVHAITGDAGALAAISNEGCGRDSLRDLVADAACDGDCVFFVDLPSGSCLQAAMNFQRKHSAIAVVAGVNLAMLLDFVHRREASPAEAAARAADIGTGAIKVVGS